MSHNHWRIRASSAVILAFAFFGQHPTHAWTGHAALCGEDKVNCIVQFSNEGIKAGPLVIPAGRVAGWGAIDKSERTCNVFGVCYRSVFQSENQEFTISYLNDNNQKSTLLVSFVNASAALKFSQEIQAFTLLAQAMKGFKPTEVLSDAEAADDILTRTPPPSPVVISFSDWKELTAEKRDGKIFKRYYAPRLTNQIFKGIYQYNSMFTGEGQTVQLVGRIDCERSLVTVSEQAVIGADRNPVRGWSKPVAIVPGQMAFEIAQIKCSFQSSHEKVRPTFSQSSIALAR